MGPDDQEGFPSDGEGPVREVSVNPFYIDATTITNEEFKRFVEDTGYQTEAETFGWSYVFHLFVSEATTLQVKSSAHKHLGGGWFMVLIGFIPKVLILGSKIGWTIRSSMYPGMMQSHIADGRGKGS